MKARAGFLAAIAAFAVVWFGVLDYRRLIKADEGRYAEIAREMAVSGDWVTPRLNGIKYFEKPPLQYWTTAAAYKVFGENEWTARLWPALTGFLGVLLAWFAGRRLFGAHAGMFAAAILASSLLYLGMGHFNTLDMGFAFFVELALFGFLLAQEGGRRWMLLAWAALALAVLSKGIAALVLTGATLFLHSLLTRDFSPWRRLEPARGIAIFVLIAAPWFVAVSLANPEFPRFFFIHEHFERFLTTAHRRYQPAWYFIPIFLIGTLPWTTLALQALAGAWRRVATADNAPASSKLHGWPPEGRHFQSRRFLLLWCIVVFGFFSASSSKLPSYILPLFPALALLLGDALTRISRRALLGHLALLSVLAALAAFFAPRVADRADHETPIEMMAPYAHWLTASAMLGLVGTLGALELVRRNRKVAAVMALACAWGLAGLGAMLGHENLSRSNSSYHIAMKVKPLLPAGVPFYAYRMYDQTLTYYLARTVTLVAYRDEMSFGLDQEPDKWIASPDEFKLRWTADADAFAVMEPAEHEDLRSQGLPMIEIARDTRRVIVRKPQP